QERHHLVLKDKESDFHRAIFYQRPLKSPAGMVGRCSLEQHHPRAPRAQMVAQEFRVEKQIADLRWGKGKSAEKLAPEQRNAIRDLLVAQREVSLQTI